MFKPAAIYKTVLITLCLCLLSANVLATKVTMQTSLGDFEIELFDNDAPGTVENFLNYVNDGDYEDSFIHRSVPGFVIQGGGFNFKNGGVGNVPTDPPIKNEFNQSNLRGTIAMAKVGGDVDSATSQWFINLDNNTNLDGDDGQGGGFFTVFGKVIGNGMDVVDAIAALQRVNVGGALTELPVRNFNGGTVVKENLIFANVVLSGTTEPTPTGCDSAFVSMNPNKLILEVVPTGADDTINIQCALNKATDEGVPIVRLAKGEYQISQVLVKNFKGSFQGTNQTDTIINITDTSIDCSAQANAGLTPAAIKFVRGEPRIRFMTINANQPCSNGSLVNLIHFTGLDANDSACGNDISFGVVNRMSIHGPGKESHIRNAISASPEGSELGGCKDMLLGTFNINHVDIDGFTTGADTRMQGRAQVDISFTEFNNNQDAINIVDSSQSTTISFSKINSTGAANNGSAEHGISVMTTLASPPESTRVIVNQNTFNFADPNANGGSLINTHFDTSPQEVSLAVTNNTFVVDGNQLTVIEGNDLDSASIATNQFTGMARFAITAEAIIKQIIKDWTITANTGLGSFSTVNDIVLGADSSQMIIGAAQDASVDDQGSGNTIL